MASTTETDATSQAGDGRSRGRRNRRPPSPAEQRRRVAQMTDLGRQTAARIKRAIAEAEAA